MLENRRFLPGGDPIPHVPPPKRHPYDQWCPDARALDLVGDKWTLLIVRDLASGPRRFVELQRVLPGISTEQLRSRLNRMVADGMLTRRRYREVPPRVEYELTERARQLMPVLGELARWGYEWAWGAPRTGERIDIGAIFRLAPGLLRSASDVQATLQLTVEDASEDGPVTWTLLASGGEVTIEERDADNADASVSGTTDQWVRAFSPDGDFNGLKMQGNEALAAQLLDGLALTAERALRATGTQAARAL
jgi:DNA-binding HxlR family transcriptional regulator